jgi:hypothetical protein
MNPALFLLSGSIAAAFVSSFLVSACMTKLSDKRLAQDLTLIQRAFDTNAMLLTTPTQQRDVVSYYARTTNQDYRLLEFFVGPGLHTRLHAAHPISHAGNNNARQVVINAIIIIIIICVKKGRRS